MLTEPHFIHLRVVIHLSSGMGTRAQISIWTVGSNLDMLTHLRRVGPQRPPTIISLTWMVVQAFVEVMSPLDLTGMDLEIMEIQGDDTPRALFLVFGLPGLLVG